MPADAERGHVWLVGMPGAGKTTVGRMLAERLGWPFVDVDQRIEREAGRSVSEIFAADGEAAFRAREAAAVRALSGEARSTVIAPGGGAPCFGDSLAAMQQSGLVVWLRAPAAEVFAGLDFASRPLLSDGDDPRRRWLGLEAERRETYGQATLVVDRRGRAAERLADEIAGWLADFGDAPLGTAPARTLWVELGERRYPILLDDGADAAPRFAAALARIQPPGRAPIAVVTDETVGRLHLPRYRAALQHRGFAVTEVVVPDGEGSKTMARAAEVAERLATAGLDRRSAIVALGGGVVGDLAGFVAATLYRGVALVQVPTTLLAMVDSSVGGKTGVNLGAGKNLVGAFHQPRLVYVALETLATLAPRDLSAGLAEVLKHALLDGADALSRLGDDAEAARRGDRAVLARLVAHSCALKARVVAGDEREEQAEGGRVLLNLGHTVGHALESHSHRRPRAAEGPLRHGEAVGLGLVAAARIGRRSDGAQPDLEQTVAALLGRLGLPSDLDARLADPDALADLAADKKRAAGRIRYVALDAPGAPRIVALAPDEIVRLVLPHSSSPAPSLGTNPEAAP